eukprot:m.239480 g.239480  ORF g.239480 m.239480 type:complete len:477 (+) comp18978_c0_seq5:108-1538(+)
MEEQRATKRARDDTDDMLASVTGDGSVDGGHQSLAGVAAGTAAPVSAAVDSAKTEDNSEKGNLGNGGDAAAAASASASAASPPAAEEAAGAESADKVKHKQWDTRVYNIPTVGPDGKPLSKNQIKKLKRTQRWEEGREQRKQKRKERRQASRGRKAELLAAGDTSVCRRRKSLVPMSQGSAYRIVVDASFEEFMVEKDIVKLYQQVRFSYAVNRRSEKPVQYYITSYGGVLKARCDMNDSGGRWDIHLRNEHYTEVFDKADIVYLSSESETVLNELDETKAYIIGGLVDHNKHKGLTHRMAVEQGVAHARLPIGEFIKMASRKVLTVNHVFEIMLHFSIHKDWEKAFFSVIPQRKLNAGEASAGGKPSGSSDGGKVGGCGDADSPEDPVPESQKVCIHHGTPEGCTWEQRVGRPCRYLHVDPEGEPDATQQEPRGMKRSRSSPEKGGDAAAEAPTSNDSQGREGSKGGEQLAADNA